MRARAATPRPRADVLDRGEKATSASPRTGSRDAHPLGARTAGRSAAVAPLAARPPRSPSAAGAPSGPVTVTASSPVRRTAVAATTADRRLDGQRTRDDLGGQLLGDARARPTDQRVERLCAPDLAAQRRPSRTRGPSRRMMPAMLGLGAILTAIVTPFDADRSVDEDAFVALHGAICATTAPTASSSAGRRARRRRWTDEEHLRLIELAVRERPRGHDGHRRHRLQRHAPRRATDRARDRAGRRRHALGHPVLQPAQPARDPRPLRGGRAGDRQADRPLQHPPAHRRRHAQRPAGRAGPDRARRRRQAGQQRRTSRSSTGSTSTPATTTCSARTLDLGGAGRHLRRQPRRRRRDAPDGRRARPARRASTSRSRPCSRRWRSPPTRSR